MAGLEFKSFLADWRNVLKSIALGFNIQSKTAVLRKEEGLGAISALQERGCRSHLLYEEAVRRRQHHLFLGEKVISWGKDVDGRAGKKHSTAIRCPSRL